MAFKIIPYALAFTYLFDLPTCHLLPCSTGPTHTGLYHITHSSDSHLTSHHQDLWDKHALWLADKTLLKITRYIITISRVPYALKKNRYMYMYNWITLLYTWNYHNTVHQLHSDTHDFHALSYHKYYHSPLSCMLTVPICPPLIDTLLIVPSITHSNIQTH